MAKRKIRKTKKYFHKKLDKHNVKYYNILYKTGVQMENKGNIGINADRHLCKTCCYRAPVKGNELKNKCTIF